MGTGIIIGIVIVIIVVIIVTIVIVVLYKKRKVDEEEGGNVVVFTFGDVTDESVPLTSLKIGNNQVGYNIDFTTDPSLVAIKAVSGYTLSNVKIGSSSVYKYEIVENDKEFEIQVFDKNSGNRINIVPKDGDKSTGSVTVTFDIK